MELKGQYQLIQYLYYQINISRSNNSTLNIVCLHCLLTTRAIYEYRTPITKKFRRLTVNMISIHRLITSMDLQNRERNKYTIYTIISYTMLFFL